MALTLIVLGAWCHLRKFLLKSHTTSFPGSLISPHQSEAGGKKPFFLLGKETKDPATKVAEKHPWKFDWKKGKRNLSKWIWKYP